MLIAQITDTHIKRKGRRLFGVIDTAKHLRRCVEELNALDPQPDVVLATGDLADGGEPREYKRLRRILDDLAMPAYLVPGNHDHREHLREAFDHHGYLPREGPYLHYVVDEHPVRLVALDTTAPGRAGGDLDDARLAWLDERLAEAPERPTLVFMHHPPFRTGIAQMDALGFTGVDGLAEVVRSHPQIERIVCGHIHRTMQVAWSGTTVCVCPSTAYQLVLALRSERPLGLTLERPGFALHAWTADGMVSHTCTVEKRTVFVPSDDGKTAAVRR